jgi:polysaccharide export outer membrane protein
MAKYHHKLFLKTNMPINTFQFKSNKILIALFLVFFFNSCVSYKKQIFFQGLKDTTYTASMKQPDPIIQRGDQLSIMVYALDQVNAQFFNQPMGGGQGGNMNQMFQQGGQGGGIMGYLVDEYGNIEFPKLGTMKVLGYTQQELRDSLKNKLAIYIKEPIISVRLLNFRVTFITSDHASTAIVTNNKTHILQFLGSVGGISWMDKRDNIVVIRQIDSKRQVLRVNLTDASIFQSPAYYLQPNDIIYVEPNKRKFLETNIQLLSYVTPIASTLSILLLYINGLTK